MLALSHTEFYERSVSTEGRFCGEAIFPLPPPYPSDTWPLASLTLTWPLKVAPPQALPSIVAQPRRQGVGKVEIRIQKRIAVPHQAVGPSPFLHENLASESWPSALACDLAHPPFPALCPDMCMAWRNVTCRLHPQGWPPASLQYCVPAKKRRRGGAEPQEVEIVKICPGLPRHCTPNPFPAPVYPSAPLHAVMPVN